jgi:hypothetical protein
MGGDVFWREGCWCVCVCVLGVCVGGGVSGVCVGGYLGWMGSLPHPL